MATRINDRKSGGKEHSEPAPTTDKCRDRRFVWISTVAFLLLVVGGWSISKVTGVVGQIRVSATERATLVAEGQKLVFEPERRAVAPPIRLPTASYGDGSIFDLAEERGNKDPKCIVRKPSKTPDAAGRHKDAADEPAR